MKHATPHQTEPDQMTMTKARSIARNLGLTIKKTDWDDFRVNYRGGSEETAYYTDDLEDATDTIIHMAEVEAATRKIENDTFGKIRRNS